MEELSWSGYLTNNEFGMRSIGKIMLQFAGCVDSNETAGCEKEVSEKQ